MRDACGHITKILYSIFKYTIELNCSYYLPTFYYKHFKSCNATIIIVNYFEFQLRVAQWSIRVSTNDHIIDVSRSFRSTGCPKKVRPTSALSKLNVEMRKTLCTSTEFLLYTVNSHKNAGSLTVTLRIVQCFINKTLPLIFSEYVARLVTLWLGELIPSLVKA